MAITSYTTLKSAIADFLNRSDLTAVIPTFIGLAEAEMNARVRHWRMEDTNSQSVSSQYATMPTGWVETIRLSIGTSEGQKPLRLMSQYDLTARRHDDGGVTGEPYGYALTDGAFELYPVPDDTYTLETVFYKRPDALADDADTNWILTYFPAAYLYGALKHSAPYLQEDGRVQVWAALFEDALAVIARDDSVRFSGTGLRVRMRAV